MSDGTSIVLKRHPGADARVYAVPEDQVDYHWLELAKAAVPSTILSVGASLRTHGFSRGREFQGSKDILSISAIATRSFERS